MELILRTPRQLAKCPGRLRAVQSQRKSTATQHHQRPDLKLLSLQHRRASPPHHVLSLAASHAPRISQEVRKMLCQTTGVISGLHSDTTNRVISNAPCQSVKPRSPCDLTIWGRIFRTSTRCPQGRQDEKLLKNANCRRRVGIVTGSLDADLTRRNRPAVRSRSFTIS